MKNFYYDFHIHSCLSPCGDNDMTPNNIAGMAKINGLDIVALTDHNSAKNCPAFFEAARRYSIIPVAGMELTTAEDIHVVCLFEELEAALEFGEAVNSRRVLIPNRVEIFGEQLVLDGEDELIEQEKFLLPNATDISFEAAPQEVEKYSGICFPAHIDRSANSVIETLGVFPETPHFDFTEYRDSAKIDGLKERFPILENKPWFVSSDAHYLENIYEQQDYFTLGCQDEAAVRSELFSCLRRGIKP